MTQGSEQRQRKVLFVVCAHHAVGGLETSIGHMATALKTEGFDSSALVARSQYSSNSTTDDFLGRFMPVAREAGLRSSIRLLRSVDLIHIQAATSTIFPARLIMLARLLGRPVVTSIRLPAEPSRRPRRRGRFVQRIDLLARGALLHALSLSVFADSDDAAAVAKSRYAPVPVEVRGIQHGAPDAGYSALPPGPAFAPILIGRLSTQPDHKKAGLFVEALVALANRGVAMSATIVGDGDAKSALQTAAATSGLSDSITFTGFVDNAADYLERADVLVIASEHEGLPLVAMEAASVGRGILCRSSLEGFSDGWGDAVDFVTPNATATDFADAMKRLAHNRSRLIEMGEQARKVYEQRFSTELAAAAHAQAYRRVLGIAR